jgi:hypothetical protein
VGRRTPGERPIPSPSPGVRPPQRERDLPGAKFWGFEQFSCLPRVWTWLQVDTDRTRQAAQVLLEQMPQRGEEANDQRINTPMARKETTVTNDEYIENLRTVANGTITAIALPPAVGGFASACLYVTSDEVDHLVRMCHWRHMCCAIDHFESARRD